VADTGTWGIKKQFLVVRVGAVLNKNAPTCFSFDKILYIIIIYILIIIAPSLQKGTVLTENCPLTREARGDFQIKKG